MTRIFTDNIINKNCIYLIINNIKISAYPRFLRHPRSKILLRQPQIICLIFLIPQLFTFLLIDTAPLKKEAASTFETASSYQYIKKLLIPNSGFEDHFYLPQKVFFSM